MENDPTGRNPHEAGAKLDAGKLRAGLVLGDFSRALTEVCAVGTFGANKYTPHGWLSVPDAQERYTDAMMRHWLKDQTGEIVDPDSGLSHKAHFAWNALALLELTLRSANVEAEVKTRGIVPEQSPPMQPFAPLTTSGFREKDIVRIKRLIHEAAYDEKLAKSLFPHLFSGGT